MQVTRGCEPQDAAAGSTGENWNGKHELDMNRNEGRNEGKEGEQDDLRPVGNERQAQAVAVGTGYPIVMVSAESAEKNRYRKMMQARRREELAGRKGTRRPQARSTVMTHVTSDCEFYEEVIEVQREIQTEPAGIGAR